MSTEDGKYADALHNGFTRSLPAHKLDPMPQDYTVNSGDCMSSIAYENGFYWKTLWNLPQNSALKAQRKNPNVLMTGDVVHIPDLTVRQEPGATEATHKFMLKGVPEIFHIRLLDAKHKPRANLDYVIVIEGKSRRGKTDAQGGITESIPPNARTGKLTFAEPQYMNKKGKLVPAKPKNQVMRLQLGNLNPIAEVSGLKARLANLGFYHGAIDENINAATKHAISDFQRKKGLPVTGIADDATKSRIQKLHGHWVESTHGSNVTGRGVVLQNRTIVDAPIDGDDFHG